MASASLTISICEPAITAARTSISSVGDALCARCDAREHILGCFPDLLEADGTDGLNLIAETGDLVRADCVSCCACGTDSFNCVVVRPTDRYTEFCAAVANHGKYEIVVSHGWPILSVVAATTTVAEAAGASSPGGEACPPLAEMLA